MALSVLNISVSDLFVLSSGSQVAYVTSPLLVPPWAIANVAVGLVFWIYIVATACYYMNALNTGYLPFQSSESESRSFQIRLTTLKIPNTYMTLSL